MTQTRLEFPPGFLWGTATAAHQVEGNNTNNDWWQFETRPGTIWHDDRSGLACNWWADAESDFDLMAAMGHNTHRLSIEWSRIEPEEGRYDPAAIARYRDMLTALHRHSLEPMVTLFHFSTPLWLARQGGWSNPAVISHFRRFAHHAVDQLGDLVRLWCTINEPNVYAAVGYLYGEHAPGQRSLPLYFRVLRHELLAHAAAYRVIRAFDAEARVGIVKNIQVFQPLDPDHTPSALAARFLDYLFNEITLHAVHDGRLCFPLAFPPTTHGPLVDSLDFFGLNYYSRQRVSLAGGPLMRPTPGAEISDFGRHGTYGEIYPAGLYQTIQRVARFGKPIYITENGLPDADDDQRPRFLVTHLAAMQRAIAQGADVRGYYHWSFTDNFEWAEGWALRFGLVHLDPTTQLRTPRPSAALYSRIIAENAITGDMIATYAPDMEVQA
ncbi:MAG: glycoside hydrolase family 1 protein [Anaerolineae bacterium]|nr:glycoside hydrolase family 1 protein [Anaerolineae bacterium]